MDIAVRADLFYGLLYFAYFDTGDRVDHIADDTALLDVNALLLQFLELLEQSFTLHSENILLQSLLCQKLRTAHRLLHVFDHIIADVQILNVLLDRVDILFGLL